MKKLAPHKIGDWAKSGEDRIFDRQTIFSHLNGGAEVYLHYGMVRLLAREYARPRAAGISLLIFDMGAASNAYGVYTHERGGEPAGVGQDSDLEGALLRFWRGRYFVSITSFRHTGPARRAVVGLGQAIAGRIRSPGQRPALVGRLPAKGLDAATVRYLRSDPILPLILPALAGATLGLEDDAEVVVAEYDEAKGRLTALVASFPTAQRAERAHAGLKQPAGQKGKVHARRCGATLIAVLGPDQPAGARARLLKRMAGKQDKGCEDGQ